MSAGPFAYLDESCPTCSGTRVQQAGVECDFDRPCPDCSTGTYAPIPDHLRRGWTPGQIAGLAPRG